mgnify:CR=1 FL=1|tara:strand:- start:40 stop:537 length:498 start_codon:yes stop_codon:yes gene_type:complete
MAPQAPQAPSDHAFAWHKDNTEITKELAIIAAGEPGPEFDAASQSFAKRIQACAVASHDYLIESGFHVNTHPGILQVGMREIKSGEKLQSATTRTGRPSINADRNLALVAAVIELREIGVGVADACEKVARELLTKSGVDGHTDNLTGRSVQRIYQGRDKSDEQQ